MHLLIDDAHKPTNSIELDALEYRPGHVFDFDRLREIYGDDFLTMEKLETFRDMVRRARFPEGEFHELVDLYEEEVRLFVDD